MKVGSTSARKSLQAHQSALLGLLALLLPLVAGVPAHAQAPGVRLGEVQTLRKYEAIGENVLATRDGLFFCTLDMSRSTFGLEKTRSRFAPVDALNIYNYDEGLRVGHPTTLTWEGDRSHYGISAGGSNLLWTYVTEGRGTDTYELNTDVIDPTSGKITASHRVAQVRKDDYKSLNYESARSNNRGYSLQVFNEQSGNRLLSERDDERPVLSLSVIGVEGEAVTQLREPIGIPQDHFEITSVAVGDDGTAYVTARTYDNSGRREGRREPRYDVRVYTAVPGAEKLAESPLRLGKKFIVGTTVLTQPNGQPIVFGLYSEQATGAIRGVFTARYVSADLEPTTQPFSPEILKQLDRRVTGNPARRPVSIGRSFDFRATGQRPDGTVVLLLESFMANTTCDVDGSSSSTDVRFGTNILLELDAFGALTAATVIPKAQSTTLPQSVLGAGSMSRYQRHKLAKHVQQAYNPALGVGLVRLANGFGAIYNDEVRNHGRPVEKRPFGTSWRKAVATLAYVDREGKLVRSPLFERRAAGKMLMHVANTAPLPDGKIAFVASRYRCFGKREIRLGIIDPTGMSEEAHYGLRD